MLMFVMFGGGDDHCNANDFAMIFMMMMIPKS
jgi:hypothetical protein